MVTATATLATTPAALATTTAALATTTAALSSRDYFALGFDGDGIKRSRTWILRLQGRWNTGTAIALATAMPSRKSLRQGRSFVGIVAGSFVPSIADLPMW